MNLWIHELNAAAGVWAASAWRASWQGGIAIGLVWGIGRAFPKFPSRLRCWLWRLAYLKLLAAFLWIEPISIPVLPAARTSVGSVPTDSKTAEPPTISNRLNRDGSRTLLDSQLAIADETFTFSAALLVLWLSGLGWAIARVAGHWRNAQKDRRACAPVQDDAVANVCAQLVRQLGLRRAPELLVSYDIASPMLAGVVHPAIMLPRSVLSVEDSTEIRIILAHELAHVKRHDLFWAWLPTLAEICFFFHPLMRLAKREWRFAQESACDELAVRSVEIPPASYGAVLLHLATGKREIREADAMAVGIVESYKTLERRLKAMKHFTSSDRLWMRCLTGIVVAVAVLAIPTWRLSVRAQPVPQNLASAEPAPASLPPASAKAEPSATRLVPIAVSESRSGKSKSMQRELLQEEIGLVEQQINWARKARDNGRLTTDQLIKFERDRLALKRELARMEGNPSDERRFIEEEIGLVEQLLREMKSRIEVGASAPGDEISVKRELLALKRELIGLPPAEPPQGNKEEIQKPSPDNNDSGRSSSFGKSLDVLALRGGYVKRVLVKEGARVKKGDVLVEFDDPDAKVRLTVAMNRLDLAKAAFKAQENETREFTAEYDRRKELAKTGQLSQSDQKAFMASLVKAELSGIEMRQSESLVEQAKLELDRVTIRAPIDGFISNIHVSEGQYVPIAPNKVVLEIRELETRR